MKTIPRQCPHGHLMSCAPCGLTIAKYMEANLPPITGDVNAVAPMWSTPAVPPLERVREAVRQSKQELFSKSEVLALLEGDNADR